MIDLYFNLPEKKFRMEFIHPKKKIKASGKLEASRNSRLGHLELVLDDSNVYYIKGRTDLQTVGGEQRYVAQLEAQLLKHGSPIILLGNVTKQPGKKMALSVALVNLLKDTTFLSVCLEKKTDDHHLRQFSLEGETHIPGVLGSYIIGILQQRGSLWSTALRIKYGLFGDARNLQHECSMAQKFKVENSPHHVYSMNLEHEMFCTQIFAYNHKFTVQVPEQHVDYRTRLQHSYSTQSVLESSTNFKVQYNNHMPFVADLRWKDASRHALKKWEGMLNMDTPWLYLYVAHRLQQPQRSAYLATTEFTAGKAFVVKGLVVELFGKDRGDEKEGRVRIHTPTTTYLQKKKTKGPRNLHVNFQASSFNRLEKDSLHSQTEIMSLWNQLVTNELHVQNREETKTFHFLMKSAKQEFNLTTTYFHREEPQKTNVSLGVWWSDHKNVPIALQLEAQIEELKKEKWLYQKRGVVQFRHPLELPIPQSFLLQETFTVNKRGKYYFLETRVLINGLEESLQTLTLSYQAENPYICAGLVHPYNGEIVPQNIDVCAVSRNLSRARSEVEATLKINKEKVFCFLGKYQNKSSMASSQHLVQMDMKHAFQAQAAASRHGKNHLNGSFSLHSSGKDLVLLEATFDNQWKKGTGAVSVIVVLKQAVLRHFRSAWLKLAGKVSPSRLVLSSVMELDQNIFHLDLIGSKEQKAGLALTLHSSIRHNVDGLKCLLPLDFSLDGSLKRRSDTHEGALSMKVNQSVYGLYFETGNLFGNTSWHNITIAVTQNGSRSIPSEAQLRGQLELSDSIQRGSASFQVDTRSLCVNLSSTIIQAQAGLTGTFTHNMSTLYAAGLPTESIIVATYGQSGTNHTVTFKLRGGDHRMTAVFELETLSSEALIAHLGARFMHNLTELERRGIPFVMEVACHYQNFSHQISFGVTVQLDEKQIKVQLGSCGTNSTAGLVLSLRHNVGLVLHVIPPVLEIECDGESTSNRLSGHCSGEVAGGLFETPVRILLNGSVVPDNFTADFTAEVVISEEVFAEIFVHAASNLEHHLEISIRNTWPYLSDLGLEEQNRIKILAVGADEYKGLLEVTLGECELTGDGGLDIAGDITIAAWKVQLLNKCGILEEMMLPRNLDSRGSFLISTTNVSLTASLHCDGRTADLQLRMSVANESHAQGIPGHPLPPLHHQGRPPEISIPLSVMNGSKLVGHLLLQVENCKLMAEGEILAKNRTEWMLEWETDCKVLQDLGAPGHSQLTGSIWRDGCRVESLGTLRSGHGEALLELRTECQPRVSLEVDLRHDLPFLRKIPRENKLFVDCGKWIGQDIRLHWKAGPCELHAGLSFHAANQYLWQLENHCKAIQDLGVPMNAEGSGHIVIGKKDVDSEVLVTAGENTFHGLLVFNITNTRHELNALLTHNFPRIIQLGIPAKTLVDLIAEKKSAIRKRVIQFSVDDKQITEELSYTQKPDHVAFKYKLMHNLEALKVWWLEDEIELQAVAVLKDVKNFMMKVQYGSCWVNVGGQIHKINGSLNLRGNLQHKWPWLLQADIPEAIQVLMSFRINPTQERRTQTVAGQAQITYSANAIHVDRPSNTRCGGQSDDVALGTSSCQKAINLTFMLQKLVNRARLAFEGEFNNKTMTVILEIFSGADPHGPFELTAEFKHSLNHLKHLGIPFGLKLTLLEILSTNKTEGTLKVACDSDLSLLFVFSAQNEWHSEEFSIKSLQNLPFLRQYLPSIVEFSSKMNYSTKEGEEKLSIHMENKNSFVLTKVTSAGPNCTQVLRLVHTMPQLTTLPRQLVLTTMYQKSKRTRALRWSVLWDGKEANFTGSYTGLFPKVSGGHDVEVEIRHPFSVPFPKHAMLKVHVEHSLRSHRDNIVIGWDSKDQMSISSSLKFGKEHSTYRATITHPFNFTMNQMQVNYLIKNRGGTHNHQVRLTWNDGQPAHLNWTFRDKSKAKATFWDACITASSSQLQKFLPVGSLQVCGSIEQTTALFNQRLDVKWDNKRVKQNLTFERNKSSHRDMFHLDTILENIFFTSCSNQRILGNVETDYAAWLHHRAILQDCNLPNEIAVFGKHQFNKGDLLLQSEGKVNLAGDEASITVAFRNHSQAKERNYSMEFAIKASQAVWLDMIGNLWSSAGRSQVVMEANVDPKEKVKLAASKEKGCLRYYMGYSKGSAEDGLEFTACMDGRHQAALSAHLVTNGAKREEMGRLALKATNQSLNLEAHGCGDPVLKIESKLTEMASALQRSLMAKLRNLEERLGDLGKWVQHIDFLSRATSWPENTLRVVVGTLQNGTRGITHIWKQSGIKQALQHSLPLYLSRIQVILQQMQNELHRPLTTLKDAYYDATLKPLDQVWQQKTEEYLMKLQAFLPTIIKDAWLMEPIQVSLQRLKMGLDLVTQQMLSWAEDKLSRAMSKIQKPLSNLYHFSARNCSVMVRLPVLSDGEPTLNLANLTNYLIEEKLMKPIRKLYHINPTAEYYRFKQTLMESPFEHQALLIGTKHLRTFDGNIYSLSTNCSLLLAKDFVNKAFTVILNQDDNGLRSLHVDMNGTSVVIYPEQKIYQKHNISMMENCQNLDIPLKESGVTVQKELDNIAVSSTNGIRFSCDLRYNLCKLNLDGWHHGTSAGLFGTNDNEGGNEWMLPDHSNAGSLQEFIHGWQVTHPCPPVKKTDKSCRGNMSFPICKSFFRDSSSFFRNCFRVVDPETFYNLCTSDMCESHNIRSACALAAAFVHLCNRNFVPLEMPLQCDREPRLGDSI